MRRRTLLALVLVGALFAGLLAAGMAARLTRGDQARISAAATGPRPNVVLLTTDDQTLAEMRFLPSVRRLLGRQGVEFRNFVAPHPLCCPSRAQILTGQYAQNNGVRDNLAIYGGHDELDAETALPVWLQGAGYRTGFVGRYLNGYTPDDGIEVGWDFWDPTTHDLYAYAGFGQYTNGREQAHPDEYHTDYVAERTAGLIEQWGDGDAPFFLWSSFVAPHGSCSVALPSDNCSAPPIPEPRDATRYRWLGNYVARKPSFNERDVSDKPSSVVADGRVDPAESRRLLVQRARTLASVDRAVRRIIRELRVRGHLDDTVVLFTSDNGYLFGEHRYAGKILAYDESVRVPLLMRGPGIPRGEVRSQLAGTIDLAPTIAALARAPRLIPVDGRSLLPWAVDDARQPDRTMLVQAGARGRAQQQEHGWKFRGVRTRRYTFVRWTVTGFVELYDRRRDPYELENRARDPRYQQVRSELERRLRRLRGCSGGSCRTGFAPLPAPAVGQAP